MLAEMFQQLVPFVYILAVLCYLVFIRYLDRLEYRYRKNRPPTDEECMARVAALREISEYAIFQEAVENWNISAGRMETDFAHYLKTGLLPHYVRDFIRKYPKEIDPRDSSKFPFNDSLPPSWPV